MVTLESNQRIPMNQLSVGDRVLSMDETSGKPTFSEVLMFMHHEEEKYEDFVSITASCGTSTTLTPNHLIYITDNATSDMSSKKAVFASDVTPGQHVYTLLGNGSVATSLVRRVGLVRRKDVIAPLTGTGNIIVDDTVASCYGVFTHEA